MSLRHTRLLCLASLLLAMTLAFAPSAHAATPAADASGLFGAWTIAWVVGLLSGVALMVFTAFDWRNFPALTHDWLQRQRRNYGWAMLSIASIAVLAFY